MAIASVSAMPSTYGTKIAPAASGFRPSASIALLTAIPRPMPGPIAPSPMASPTARFESTSPVPPVVPCLVESRADFPNLGRPLSGSGMSSDRIGARRFRVIVVVRGVLRDRHADVGHRQQREDERLDETEDQLQSEEDTRNEEGERNGEGRKGGDRQHGGQQDLAGEHVAK